jgi:hypothetical protein
VNGGSLRHALEDGRRAAPSRAGAGVRMRLRKLIGTVALVVFVAVYALAAMTVGAAKLAAASGWAQLAYFLVAGLIWVAPAGLLIRWMAKPDRPAQ